MEKIKTGVIGLGLTGGSIFKSLSAKGYDVIGISKSQKGENISSDISDVKKCDVIFVCSEIPKILETLEKLEDIADKKTIVTDVSSVKNFLEGKIFKFNFISSHPMAGTEFRGFENSSGSMFEGANWFIEKNNDILEKLIKDMGAKTIVADLCEHDTAAALISHMPAFLSCALFEVAKNNKLALALASGGFRDMTRLCLNPTLASDMLKYNKDNITSALDDVINAAKYLKNLSDDDRIKLLEENAKARGKMYDNGKNKTIY